jgi:hypothetical protein
VGHPSVSFLFGAVKSRAFNSGFPAKDAGKGGPPERFLSVRHCKIEVLRLRLPRLAYAGLFFPPTLPAKNAGKGGPPEPFLSFRRCKTEVLRLRLPRLAYAGLFFPPTLPAKNAGKGGPPEPFNEIVILGARSEGPAVQISQ